MCTMFVKFVRSSKVARASAWEEEAGAEELDDKLTQKDKIHKIKLAKLLYKPLYEHIGLSTRLKPHLTPRYSKPDLQFMP